MEHWELIAKKLNGEILPAEEKVFAEWLQSDPSHMQLWKEAQELWEAAAQASNGSMEVDTEKDLLELKTRLTQENHPVSSSRQIPWLKIAAAVLAVALVGFLVKSFLPGKPQTSPLAGKSISVPLPPPAMSEMRTDDSAKVFYLPDSSRIWLNKNSRLSWRENFDDTLRSLTLEGEAFFEVRHDAKKPFVVLAGNTETRVFGTSFNIKAYPGAEHVELTVVSGKVRFKRKDQPEATALMLTAQDHVVYTNTDASFQKQKTKNNEFFWWKKLGSGAKQFFEDAKRVLRKKKK